MTDDRIECLPEVMMGKPVIRGTRITVEQIIDALAAGESVEQVLGEYPRLTEADVRAALRFAAQSLRSDFVYPLATAGG